MDFMESVNGCNKEIKYKKNVKCKSCNGSRSEKNSKGVRCYTCGGDGMLKYLHEEELQECNRCEGYGVVIKHKCADCQG